MALIWADRVKETSSTTGTGTMTLAGAITGFQSFGSRMSDGDTCYYCITDGTDWEVGFGTLGGTETTLARTNVIASSNSDAAVNWTGGTEIFMTHPALYPANTVINGNTVNDNRVARFDGVSGLVIQESPVAIDDSGNLTGIGNIALSGTIDGRDIATDGGVLDTAVQPGDLADVATSGDYTDLSNKPDLSVYDEVEQHANSAAFPGTGDTSKFYLAQDTGLMYRWNGSSYTVISGQLALGETSSTAYRGDRGKTAYDHSQLTSGNPHSVTAAEVLAGWNGWIAGETWTYASALTYSNTNTTRGGTFTISGDVTTKYQPGMKVKFTQSTGGTKYGIIVGASHSGGTTTITIFLGTDYTLNNETISSPFYSHMKTPFGFNTSPDKWTLRTFSGTSRTTTSSTIVSLTDSLSHGPGSWEISLNAFAEVSVSANVNRWAILGLSSDGASSFTDDELVQTAGETTNTSGFEGGSAIFVTKHVLKTSATTWTFAGRVNASSSTLEAARGGTASPTIITAICAYL